MPRRIDCYEKVAAPKKTQFWQNSCSENIIIVSKQLLWRRCCFEEVFTVKKQSLHMPEEALSFEKTGRFTSCFLKKF